MQVGFAQNYLGDRVTVTLDRGSVSAIPVGDITSPEVIVFWQNGDWYCRCGTTPVLLNRDISISRVDPENPVVEEEVEILPFQVLTTDLLLGGDREIEDLSELVVELAGITNIGDQDYLAAWYNPENCNILTNNGTASFPACPPPTDPKWYGFGRIGLETIPRPEENLTIEETGDPLPLDLLQNNSYQAFELAFGLGIPPLGYYAFPDYPNAFEPFNADDQRSKTTTQSQEGYELSITENWDYRYIPGGTASNPSPGLTFFGICNSFNAGQTFPQTYTRNTQASYTRDTSIRLETSSQLWLNGDVFGGSRVEETQETYSYNKTPALFNSVENYSCSAPPPIFGVPVPGSFVRTTSDFNWTGETINETRNYSFAITENDWDYPASFTTTRPRRDLRSDTYSSNLTYTVADDSIFIQSGFPAGFQFEVDGVEIQQISRSQSTDRVAPELLFLSTTGRESLFVETTENKRVEFASDRERQINKILFNYSTFNPVINSIERTTEVTQSESKELYFCDGVGFLALNLANSFCFKLATSTAIAEGDLTLSNDSGDEIAAIPANIISHYLKTETAQNQANFNPTINYTEVVENPNPAIALEGREVYILAFIPETPARTIRAEGTISSYQFADTPNPDLEIETIRTIESITIDVSAIAEYPRGLVEEGQIFIYSKDNVAALVYQELLTPGNIEYCNLVNSTLYYAKGVRYNLLEATQQAEKYTILEGGVLQDTPEEGQFISMDVAIDSVLSVAYHPI